MTRPPGRIRPWSSSSSVMRCGAPTLMSTTSAKFSGFMLRSRLSRVMPALCTMMSTPPWCCLKCGRDLLGCVVGGDVEGDRAAAELVDERLQVGLQRRHVEADDGGAVAVQGADLGLAEPAGGAGDEGDLAGQRLGRVGDRVGVLEVGEADADDLAGDVGRLGGEQELQRGADGRFAALGHVDEVGRAAVADLLGQRAAEALQRALGDGGALGCRPPRGARR